MHFIKGKGHGPLRGEVITPPEVYAQRRRFLGTLAAGSLMVPWSAREALAQTAAPGKLKALPGAKSSVSGALTMEKPSSYQDVSTYNNFY